MIVKISNDSSSGKIHYLTFIGIKSKIILNTPFIKNISQIEVDNQAIKLAVNFTNNFYIIGKH